MIVEIVHALYVMHSQGIIHGNLKPTNVLLDSEFNTKLSDYSLYITNSSFEVPYS